MRLKCQQQAASGKGAARGSNREGVAKVLESTWQRCRVPFMPNALAHVGKGQGTMVLALLRTVFV